MPVEPQPCRAAAYTAPKNEASNPSPRRNGYFARIFLLFLAAAIGPALAVSLVYTAVAGSTLRREAVSRARSEAEAFAAAVAEITDRAAQGLSVLASDPDVLEALRSSSSQDPALSSRAVRKIQSIFPRESGDVEASVLTSDGKTTLVPGGYAPDLDLGVYGSWGLFRKLKDSPRNLAVSGQRGSTEAGQTTVLALALAIRGDEGEALGYAVADVRRSAFVRAAGQSRLLGGAVVLDPRGYIVLDLADPNREGYFEDELHPNDPGYGDPSLRTSALVAGEEFPVLTTLPAGLFTGFDRTARTVAILGLLGSVLVAAALALPASRSVTGPVLSLARSMRRVEAGDLSIRVTPSGEDELGDLARSFNAMTEEIAALIRGAVERQELLREAELRALAAQMNPHFLHNTLAAIKSLAKLGRSAEAAEAAARLGKLLRAGASRREEFVTVGESLASVRDYLAVERLRFGDRFAFEIEALPELENVPIPPLVLEPLTENALTHGLERKRGRGVLRLTGRMDGPDAILTVEDDGPGAPPEALSSLSRMLAEGAVPDEIHGMGLLGTNRRLRLEYGPGYGVTTGPGPDGRTGFRAEVRIPLRPELRGVPERGLS